MWLFIFTAIYLVLSGIIIQNGIDEVYGVTFGLMVRIVALALVFSCVIELV